MATILNLSRKEVGPLYALVDEINFRELGTMWKVCNFIYSWISYIISLSELHKFLHFQLSNGTVNTRNK